MESGLGSDEGVLSEVRGGLHPLGGLYNILISPRKSLLSFKQESECNLCRHTLSILLHYLGKLKFVNVCHCVDEVTNIWNT